MSSKPSPLGRTSTGWRRPTSRIESASAPIVSSSNATRGWYGLARIAATGTSR
jgi:hypothetical protein